MEIPFPYGEPPISESHIYMPQNAHSSLLENDAEHSIVVCFLYTATNHNLAIIQTKLVQLYGGQAWEYPILAISTKAYLVSLPEFLDRNQVLTDLLVWYVLNHIHVWRWEHEDGWNPTPPDFKVYIEVRNYPLQLCHPTFFHILVSDFGVPLYVDEVNSLGNDRSSLRIAVSCVDPARIPSSLLLIYDDKWRRCSLFGLIVVGTLWKIMEAHRWVSPIQCPMAPRH